MGHYNTKQRECILEYITNNKDKHINVDDIVFHLQEKNTKVGKTTVYRYLDFLEEQGKVRKYSGDTSACYQYIEDDQRCAQHHHFKCTQCNKLYHLKCETLNSIKDHIKTDHEFLVDNSKTVFYGVCKTCLKKQ